MIGTRSLDPTDPISPRYQMPCIYVPSDVKGRYATAVDTGIASVGDELISAQQWPSGTPCSVAVTGNNGTGLCDLTIRLKGFDQMGVFHEEDLVCNGTPAAADLTLAQTKWAYARVISAVITRLGGATLGDINLGTVAAPTDPVGMRKVRMASPFKISDAQANPLGLSLPYTKDCASMVVHVTGATVIATAFNSDTQTIEAIWTSAAITHCLPNVNEWYPQVR